MKRHTVLFTASVLLAVGVGAQTIEIDFIPKLGEAGSAEGRVVWSGLNAGNVGQYAVIAMLDANWGDQYVKPYDTAYLNGIDINGAFTINITTGGTGDYTINDVIFYFVDRSVFAGVNGNTVKKGNMAGKYLAMVSVSRTAFWANMVAEPTPSVPPGFVLAGTSVALSCTAGDTIRFTTNGMPVSASSPVYTGAFTVPPTGALIIHAVALRGGGAMSEPAAFTYLPRQPLDKPFFGLNVSLILGSEEPGGTLSETVTRERLQPLAPLTQWVRTFGTINNGHEYINRIAKTEMGLRTLIGVWISNDPSANTAQLNGLKAMLQQGPAPDLIAVGNECSLTGVPAGVLANVVAAVRSLLADYGMGASVPVGSVDVGGAGWSRTVLKQLDFVGVNLYSGTWDATPENQMAAATAQFYTNETQRLGNRFVLLTETGTPYSGGTYSPPAGGWQTASQTKAADYLNAMLDWTRNDRIPLFYFSAYDEAWKSRNGGHPIEQYFGLFNVNGILHPFYAPALASHRPPLRIDGITVTPSAVTLSWLDGNPNCTIHAKTNLTDMAWIPLTHATPGPDGIQFPLLDFGFRFFKRTPPN